VRRFVDDSGREWEVVAGRESWGAIYAIFVPVTGEQDVRQTQLQASSYEEANLEIDGLDESDLREMLQRSDPKRLE
jgi:hypothetical protein